MDYKELKEKFREISEFISDTAYQAEEESESQIIINCLKAASVLTDQLAIEFLIKADKPF